MAVTKKAKIPSVDEDMENRAHSCTAGGIVDWRGHYEKQCGVLEELKLELYDLTIPLPDVYLKKTETLV